MISYSNLGKAGHGRLGNQLFQIASILGLAKHFNTVASFPHWGYKWALKTELPHKGKAKSDIKEKDYHYNPKQFAEDCDISGWLQSEKYFSEGLELSDKLLNKVKHKIIKPTIGISIRRGDYVGNKNYYQLPISYYYLALDTIPNWREYEIIIFSDDVPYCEAHFGCLSNVIFSNEQPIEQLGLMSLCKYVITANSTFSWWGGWFCEKNGGIVICPNHLFEGVLKDINNIKDFYPARWRVFEHERKRYNLSDVTFTIPVYFDHKDRQENLEMCIAMLKKYFATNIVVMEHNGDKFKYLSKYVQYKQCKGAYFHRTKMLNDMAKEAETPFVFNWDADITVSPLQIIEAVDMLRGGVDMVYPYDGRFARVPRLRYKELVACLDVGTFANDKFVGTRQGDMISVGGAVGFNVKSLLEGGGENERFISYGAEDVERYHRFKLLGYKVERVKGILYHIDHFISKDSSTKHEHFEANQEEWRRVQKLTKEQLKEYIRYL